MKDLIYKHYTIMNAL